MRYFIIALLAALVFLTAGCYTNMERGSLSEAMDKSSDNNKGSRQVADTRVRREEDKDNGGFTFFDFLNAVVLSDEKTKERQGALPEDEEPRYDNPRLNAFSRKELMTTDTIRDTLKWAQEYLIRYKALPTVYVPKTASNVQVVVKDDSGGTYHYSLNDSSRSEADSAQSPKRWGITADKSGGYFGVKVISGLKYASHYSNISGIGFIYADHAKFRTRHSFDFLVGVIPTTEKSDLFGSIRDISTFQADYQYRHYFTPDYTWMGLFVLVGAELKALFWGYKNSIYSDVKDENGDLLDREKITNDGVMGLGLPFGVGWSVLQTKYMKISVEAAAVMNLYWPQTFQAFNNDIFNADTELRIGLEALFGRK